MVLQATAEIQSKNRFIPDLINYIAGEFAPSISTIWEGGELSEYLMATIAQRHVWHAVLAAPNHVLPPLVNMRSWLMKSKLKDLLRVAFGTCPPGMVHLLSNLDPRAESAEFYRAVHLALSRGDVLSRILQHSRTVDPRMVFGIAYLPTDRITEKIAGYALRRGVTDFDLEELSWLGRRIGDFDQSGVVLDAISKSSNPLMAMRKAIASLTFPNPPWRVKELLPIETAGELSSIARQLDNCLADHDQFYSSCVDVQAGVAYYFRTPGDDYLLVKFSKFAGLGWYLDECRGPKNRRPTVEEIDRIAKAVSHLDGIWCRRLSYQMR